MPPVARRECVAELLGHDMDESAVFKLLGEGAKPGYAISQIVKLVTTLQARLQESEHVILEVQSSTNDIEEKCRTWRRRAERAELDRDTALKQCREAVDAVSRAHAEAVPMTEEYMEAEVLRSQMQAINDELEGLRRAITVDWAEIKAGRPRLSLLQNTEAEIIEGATDLRSAHVSDVVVQRSLHQMSMEELQEEHAERIAEAQGRCSEEIAQVLSESDIEQRHITTELENAMWQSKVYTREQQDAINGVCIRQRENARLTKLLSNARQEALELAAKLQALYVGESDVSTETKIQAVLDRCTMLEQTQMEWRSALECKNTDCEAWRQRAMQHGASSDDELTSEADWVATARSSPEGTPVMRPSAPPAHSALNTSGEHALQASPNTARELVAVALLAAQLRADEEERGNSEDHRHDVRLIDAENEAEMLVFLLKDSDVPEAVALLEIEERRQREPVARLLRVLLEEVVARAARGKDR